MARKTVRKTPWGGRFTSHPSQFLERYGASIQTDKRLWAEDIAGSIAHARMLARQDIITEADALEIEAGLNAIGEEILSGDFDFEDGDEDIHMAIERVLTERIGAPGARLHTGRSRNDQVATDTRLYAKRVSKEIVDALLVLRGSILALAEESFGVVMPGYTHLQRAQPILFSHYILAYYWMFARDTKRFIDAGSAADVLVLGSAALAGTTYPIDRAFVAEQLGFSKVSDNSIDAVSDRDFLLDLMYACSTTMMHLSRLCEELVLYSSEEFGFIRMDDMYSTGSSIMPQKKNPDYAELTRGKTGRVYGDLMALLTTLKALPLAYNKDMQEDKEGMFDAVDTVRDGIRAVRGILETMTVDEERMSQAAHGGFMAATDLADYLAASGVPFREAHEIIGKLVLACEQEGRTLQSLDATELASHHEAFKEDALTAVDINEVISKRVSFGGTGHAAVREQLQRARDLFDTEAKQAFEAND